MRRPHLRANRRQHRFPLYSSLIILPLLLCAFVPQGADTENETKTVPLESSVPAVLLQFTSGGHALGFEPDGIYLATGSHMLRECFVGTQGVAPAADRAGSRDGQMVPLGTVTYTDLWPGIRLVYDSPPGGILRSTYHIAPGADPGQIALRYNVPVSLDEKGNLVFEFETGTMTASAPIAWQTIDGQQVPVEVAFEISRSAFSVRFSLGSYNPAYPLTIDPTIAWNTFMGSSSVDKGNAIAVDGSGNVYVAGTSSASWGSPENAHAGGSDAFAAKLDSSGARVWHTFMGSSGDDQGNAIAVDRSGNVYVAGTSSASWGSPESAHAGGRDAFVAKLDSSGARVWHTFMGSFDDDDGTAIAVDGSTPPYIYVAGQSRSSWGDPVYANPANAHAGGSDAFAAKLDSNGVIIKNTFMGSASNDYGTAIAVAGRRDFYVAGTSSASWGTPVNAYTSGSDAFVAKLDSNDFTREWNTFIGSAFNDYGQAIVVDDRLHAYVAGIAGASWGSPVNAHAGRDDAFAAKLDADGNRVWHTFMGSSRNDQGFAIAADGSGKVYVAGYSGDSWGSPVNAHAGEKDAFAASLNSGSGALIMNTFLGSSGADEGFAIAVDSAPENVYVAGYSGDSWGSPVNAHAGGNDAFAAKLNMVEIDVLGNGVGIPDGDSTPDTADLTDFGDAEVDGGTVNHTFTIASNGLEDLNLSGSPRVSISGAHAADFTVLDTPYSPVRPGNNTDFVIQFDPSAEGLRQATVSIASNDGNEAPYDFSIQGTGTAAAAAGAGGNGGSSAGSEQAGTGSGQAGIKIGSGGGEFTYGPVKLIFPQLTLTVVPVDAPGGWDSLRLGENGRVFDIIVRDYRGAIVSEFDFPIAVCIKPSAAELSAAGGNIYLMNMYHNHAGGGWEVLGTYVDGSYVCAVVNRLSLFGLGVPLMPETGFAPGVVTVPEAQPAERGYLEIVPGLSAAAGGVSRPSDFGLEIPALELQLPIVGVPLSVDGWDVSWLDEQAGWLQGTAFPTWAGNTAITAHVWDADNSPGPFVNLHTLKYGDQVIIHAWGQEYVYEVRSLSEVRPDDLRALPHSEYDVLTLITCKGYDESSGEYDWRLAVRAILIEVR